MAGQASLNETRIFSLVLIPLLGQYVLTLENLKDQRLVPIWIGVNEGNAIGLKLQDEVLPRPMTHDLMGHMLQALSAKMEQVIISDLKDGTYYATITLALGKSHFQMDARPSDALALAVRMGSPVYVHDRVLKKCPVIMKPITGDDVDKFKEDLQNLKPEDFFKGFGGAADPDPS